MKSKQLFQGDEFLRNYFLNLYVIQIAMHTKLTLNIEKGTIEQAKLYAKQQNLSLSKLIEAYLQSLTLENTKDTAVSPVVAALTGIIPNHYDEKDAYRQYQDKKHA